MTTVIFCGKQLIDCAVENGCYGIYKVNLSSHSQENFSSDLQSSVFAFTNARNSPGTNRKCESGTGSFFDHFHYL